MTQRTELNALAQYVLGSRHTLSRKDVGRDGRLTRRGFSFETQAWEIAGVGHLSSLSMRAPFGVMRMETVFVVPTLVDMPLANLDWVSAFGTRTQIVELYDTQLVQWDESSQEDFWLLKQRDADLEGVRGSEAHWYDELLYPCSYHGKGRGAESAERLDAAALGYLVAYSDQLDAAPSCDEAKKRAKVCAFAERLVAEGGPSVEMMTKLFGPEVARRLIVEHLYGVR